MKVTSELKNKRMNKWKAWVRLLKLRVNKKAEFKHASQHYACIQNIRSMNVELRMENKNESKKNNYKGNTIEDKLLPNFKVKFHA
jgi:hypothetical protein